MIIDDICFVFSVKELPIEWNEKEKKLYKNKKKFFHRFPKLNIDDDCESKRDSSGNIVPLRDLLQPCNNEKNGKKILLSGMISDDDKKKQKRKFVIVSVT